MTTQAERDARKAELARRLAAAQKSFPVGRWYVADSEGLVRWGPVQKHELAMNGGVLVIIGGSSFWPSELVRHIDAFEGGLLDAANKKRRINTGEQAVDIIHEYWTERDKELDEDDCPGCSEPRKYCIC